MKFTIYFFILFLFLNTICYSQKSDSFTSCSLQIKSVNGLRMSKPAQLVNVKEKMTGDQNVNGYQFVYADKKQKPFVQVKAESLSSNNIAAPDTSSAFDYLRSLSSTNDSNVIRLSYNQFTMYGVVRNPETTNGIIESFMILPGKGDMLQFDFYTSRTSDAGYQNDSYLAARNAFFGDYTSQLRKCPTH